MNQCMRLFNMKFDHVIILGGGFAGILTAHMLSQHFNKISIIERCDLTLDQIKTRLPQSVHLHVLMKQGQILLEKLIPNIFEEIKQHHTPEIDWANDTKWYGPFGCYPHYSSTVKTTLFSRIFLDQILLKKMFDLKNIAIIKGHVHSLQQKNGHVYSVKYINNDTISILHGDLIIDARGKNAQSKKLLSQLGYQTPSPTILETNIAYASRFYQFNDKRPFDFKQLYLQTKPGKITKGIVISPIENNKVVVTALGLGKDRPERDENAFISFLNDLPCEELKGYLSILHPISAINTYRNFKNCHYYFGKTKKWPLGYIVIGDAACVLNPVYGQGMTLALKHIFLLKKLIEKLKSKNISLWEHHFQKKIDKLNFVPWLLATTEDSRAATKNSLPLFLRFLHYYFDQILKMAVKNPRIHILFISVLHMIKSPYQLFHPFIWIRIFYFKLKRAISI